MASKETERDLGGLLRAARAAVPLTQEEAARLAGVGLRTYARWERGENVPQGRNLSLLAEALKVPHEDLVGAAGGGAVPVNVQAERARAAAAAASEDVASLAAQVEDLTAEVSRLQRLVRTYEPPSEDQLHAIVEAIVAARLAETAATGGAPQQPDERRRAERASAS